MNENDKDFPPIWDAFCKALGTEYRDAKEIRGASGLVHPVEAIGVDDKGKRVVLVSSEHNPRVSALMRGDVQATLPDMRVLVARPLAVDLAHAARKLFFTEAGSLDVAKLVQCGVLLQAGDEGSEPLKELLGPHATAVLESVRRSSLPISSIAMSVIDQFSAFQWSRLTPLQEGSLLQSATEILTQFSEMDNLAADRSEGICPIPTYEFLDADWELFHSEKEVEEIQSRLKEMEIYQFFYPPADRLALGLVDRGVSTVGALSAGFELAEAQGHELADNSLVPEAIDLQETLEFLTANGFVVEGEISTELTAEGEEVRKSIRFRPSEGLVTKVSKLVSLKVDLSLKDLMK